MNTYILVSTKRSWTLFSFYFKRSIIYKTIFYRKEMNLLLVKLVKIDIILS